MGLLAHGWHFRIAGRRDNYFPLSGCPFVLAQQRAEVTLEQPSLLIYF
jgi:hypothetical protein